MYTNNIDVRAKAVLNFLNEEVMNHFIDFFRQFYSKDIFFLMSFPRSGNGWIRYLITEALLVSKGIDLENNKRSTYKHNNITAHCIITKSGQSFGVEDFFQDSYGFLWIVTGDGLNRYDSRNIKIYKNRQGDDSSLPDNAAYEIVEDKDRNIWIACYDGIGKFDRKTEKFKRYSLEDLPFKNPPNFYSSLSDFKGNLWFTSSQLGVLRFNAGKLTRSLVPSNRIASAILPDIPVAAPLLVPL